MQLHGSRVSISCEMKNGDNNLLFMHSAFDLFVLISIYINKTGIHQCVKYIRTTGTHLTNAVFVEIVVVAQNGYLVRHRSTYTGPVVYLQRERRRQFVQSHFSTNKKGSILKLESGHCLFQLSQRRRPTLPAANRWQPFTVSKM